MTVPFALADYLERWTPRIRHDLASSDAETLALSDLLDLATPEDLEQWQRLGFGYTDPRGDERLRTALAGRYAHLTAADILCCAGAQEALACITAAVLDPSDHAVVILPIYQPSEEAVTTRCDATGIALREEHGWRLDVADVAAALRPRTRLVLMTMPNNPTGAALDEATKGELVALCRSRGIWLLVDEVYRRTARQDLIPAIADLYERGVSIDSLSKGFGLAGLRLGWIGCRDRQLLASARDAKNRMSSCLSAPSEVLARIALGSEERIIARSRAVCERGRIRLLSLVERHPDAFADAAPWNLAFSFPRYRGREGAERFARDLALRAGILVLPSALWRSQLGPTPADRLRIGLGRLATVDALDALDDYLSVRALGGAAAE